MLLEEKEYYPDRVCKCGCGGGIVVQLWHKYRGIPKYIHGHNVIDKHHRTDCQCCSCKSKRGEMKGVRKPGSCSGRNHPRYGMHHSNRTKEKIRRAVKQRNKELWKDPVFRKKQLVALQKGRRTKPNKPERRLNALLQELLPNQYKYVGDGQFTLAGKNPDFVNVNGQKKIIELFGDYWHGEERTGKTNDEEENQRGLCFNQFGFQTLIVWEHELSDIEQLVQKIEAFNDRTICE